mmetsp:Transcript_15197/g.44446  ORF Transcript_15197/g.44446 Transcript_15197/m.44446 type:complete len:282 (-) Transcript_15197:223-1068(-)
MYEPSSVLVPAARAGLTGLRRPFSLLAYSCSSPKTSCPGDTYAGLGQPSRHWPGSIRAVSPSLSTNSAGERTTGSWLGEREEDHACCMADWGRWARAAREEAPGARTPAGPADPLELQRRIAPAPDAGRAECGASGSNGWLGVVDVCLRRAESESSGVRPPALVGEVCLRGDGCRPCDLEGGATITRCLRRSSAITWKKCCSVGNFLSRRWKIWWLMTLQSQNSSARTVAVRRGEPNKAISPNTVPPSSVATGTVPALSSTCTRPRCRKYILLPSSPSVIM